ncbi:MAG: CopG family transcriptional regulator [Candidatus Acidiferrum sp.]
MRNERKTRLSMRTGDKKTSRNVQTTLRLPKQLYERTKRHVQSEQTASLNDFIVNALAAYVRAKERKAIDDAFVEMGEDKRYRREALQIAEEFAASDAEALELTERDLVGA